MQSPNIMHHFVLQDWNLLFVFFINFGFKDSNHWFLLWVYKISYLNSVGGDISRHFFEEPHQGERIAVFYSSLIEIFCFSSTWMACKGKYIIARVYIQSHEGRMVKLRFKDHILVGRIERAHHWFRSECGHDFENLPLLLYFPKSHEIFRVERPKCLLC